MSVAVQDIERETSRLPKGNVVLDLDYSTSAVFVMLFLVPAFLLANIIGGPIHTGKEENLAFHFIDWGFYLLQAWVIWIFLLQRSTERLRELFTNISILRFIAFTALGIIGFIITSIIGLIVSDALGIEESESQACYVDFWTCWVMDGIAMIVFAPLFEEVVCRGVLFSWASHRGGILVGAIVSSVFFSAAHFDLSQGVGLVLNGFVLAMIVAKSGSLWPAIATHAIWNAMVFFKH